MNWYTETKNHQTVDLRKIAKIDVVRRYEDEWHFRWTVVLTMVDDNTIVYLTSSRLQSEDSPCFTDADRELSDDEHDTMRQVAAELMLDCSRLNEENER